VRPLCTRIYFKEVDKAYTSTDGSSPRSARGNLAAATPSGARRSATGQWGGPRIRRSDWRPPPARRNNKQRRCGGSRPPRSAEPPRDMSPRRSRTGASGLPLLTLLRSSLTLGSSCGSRARPLARNRSLAELSVTGAARSALGRVRNTSVHSEFHEPSSYEPPRVPRRAPGLSQATIA
jgi:hypothetical protein